MGHIYEIKNKINGKIYIGQTIRPIEKRLEEHRTGQSSGCRAIYNAIQKYGWENFKKDYYECPDEDLNFDEDLLVREMMTLSPDGYNLREGGGSRGKLSEETKQKLSGENHHNYGKPHSKKTKQKIGDGNRGKIRTDEMNQKNREATIGEKHPMSKRVYQYDLDGIFIDSFGSSREAGRYLEKDGSSIRECARGARRSKTAYGFKWSYTLNIFM
jgi:group I intron endonuclease